MSPTTKVVQGERGLELRLKWSNEVSTWRRRFIPGRSMISFAGTLFPFERPWGGIVTSASGPSVRVNSIVFPATAGHDSAERRAAPAQLLASRLQSVDREWRRCRVTAQDHQQEHVSRAPRVGRPDSQRGSEVCSITPSGLVRQKLTIVLQKSPMVWAAASGQPRGAVACA